MTHYVALLRAVNVGGTGKLPMSELKSLCEAAGFANVRTWIASGNVLFTSRLGESAVKTKLEQQLHGYAGKAVGVLVRTAAEMAQVLADNPYPHVPGNRVVAIFSTPRHRRIHWTASSTRRPSWLRAANAKSTCATATPWPTHDSRSPPPNPVRHATSTPSPNGRSSPPSLERSRTHCRSSLGPPRLRAYPAKIIRLTADSGINSICRLCCN